MKHFKDSNWNRCISSTIIYSIFRKNVSSKYLVRQMWVGVGAVAGAVKVLREDDDAAFVHNGLCANDGSQYRRNPKCVLDGEQAQAYCQRHQRSASANIHIDWTKLNDTFTFIYIYISPHTHKRSYSPWNSFASNCGIFLFRMHARVCLRGCVLARVAADGTSKGNRCDTQTQ